MLIYCHCHSSQSIQRVYSRLHSIAAHQVPNGTLLQVCATTQKGISLWATLLEVSRNLPSPVAVDSNCTLSRLECCNRPDLGLLSHSAFLGHTNLEVGEARTLPAPGPGLFCCNL